MKTETLAFIITGLAITGGVALKFLDKTAECEDVHKITLLLLVIGSFPLGGFALTGWFGFSLGVLLDWWIMKSISRLP